MAENSAVQLAPIKPAPNTAIGKSAIPEEPAYLDAKSGADVAHEFQGGSGESTLDLAQVTDRASRELCHVPQRKFLETSEFSDLCADGVELF